MTRLFSVMALAVLIGTAALSAQMKHVDMKDAKGASIGMAIVGLAMAGKGATVSSEAADVVVVVDRADRIPFAVRVGRRSLAIARQSVVAGLALSVGAMGFAALGYLPPVWGALFQEVIDVAVILNALRAVRG